MNVPLLRQIQETIRTKSELFHMEDFHQEKPCGTSHCIGGWAQVLAGREHEIGSTSNIAEEALEITEEQGNRLFYVTGGGDEGDEGWPLEFRGKKDDWEPTPQQAIDRIEHFIQTEGRE